MSREASHAYERATLERETATVLERTSRKFEALTTEEGVHPTLVRGVNTDIG